MTPILHDKTDTMQKGQGLGFLADIITCEVTEERNGAYELICTYPISGILFDKITNGCLIKAKPNDTAALQYFRIYKISRPINGIVTINAEHISYDLNGLPTTGLQISAATPAMAIAKAINNSGIPSNFTAVSDIGTLNNVNITTPCSIRALLAGQEGSILDVFGGEYEFDNYNIKLWQHRGNDTGIVIEYGKNLMSAQQDEEITNTYTHFTPYAKYTPQEENNGSGNQQLQQEIIVTLPEQIIALPNAEVIGHNKALIMDFSDKFKDGEIITVEALRTKATAYAAKSDLGIPKVNITVSFVNLWQTAEYANIAILERVNLCDNITIRFTELGINATAKVIKTVYDVLKERYNSIELGEAKSKFADTILKTENTTEQLQKDQQKGFSRAAEALRIAIINATNLITGQSGGYVVLNPPEKPQEILIMDTPDINTATKVWRWNSGGLGYSNNGYNGDFGLALTMDGAIVADYITAGIIRGALIEADSIDSVSISQSFKMEITNEIGQASESLEQAFVAADGQLLSLIEAMKKVVTDNDTEIHERIALLQQTIDSLNISYTDKFTGGINHLHNSSGLNGVSDDWEYTGSVVVMQTNEAVTNTMSDSMFRLSGTLANPATLSQTVTVIEGLPYTLTFKSKRDTSNRCRVWVTDNTDKYIFDQYTTDYWTEYAYTFTAQSNKVTLNIATTGSYFYIADIMLTQGDTKSRWTPAPNEIYTKNVKIDRKGINITNSGSRTETIIDNTQFAVRNNGETVLTVNKDLTTLQRTEVLAELTIGKGKFVPVVDGLNFVLLD